MSETFVSLVLPVYNEGERVIRCVDSLLRQSHRNLEIIIVDDGSTDETLAILEKLSKNYQSTKIMRTLHKGVSHARNVGISEARGGVISFVEADEVYHPDRIRRALRYLSSEKVGGVYQPKLLLNPSGFLAEVCNLELLIHELKYAKGIAKPVSAWTYRTDILRNVGGFDECLEVGEDKALAMKVQGAGFKIAYASEVSDWLDWPWTNSIISICRRSYEHGRKRIPLCLKYHSEIPYLRVAFFFSMMSLFALSLVDIQFLTAFTTFLILTYLIKLVQILRLGMRLADQKMKLLVIPLLSMLRNFSTVIGFLVGVALWLANRN